MPKLNQIIAIEKGVKSRVYGEITQLDKASQKPDLFNGFAKTYRRQNDESEDYPPERKAVQLRADAVISRVAKLTTEAMDVAATKDFANCNALASIEVNGVLIADNVPVTHLLFLEKQLTDLRTFIDRLPVLDEADDWKKDEQSGLFKTDPIATHRTKKTARPIVLYEATPQHPAQTQLISEDILVGYWDTVKHSGALPGPRKAQLTGRIEELLKAVKFAREQANSIEAPQVNIGEGIFDYLLG